MQPQPARHPFVPSSTFRPQHAQPVPPHDPCTNTCSSLLQACTIIWPCTSRRPSCQQETPYAHACMATPSLLLTARHNSCQPAWLACKPPLVPCCYRASNSAHALPACALHTNAQATCPHPCHAQPSMLPAPYTQPHHYWTLLPCCAPVRPRQPAHATIV